MPFSLSALSHSVAALGYFAFAIFLAVTAARTWLKAFMLLAAVLTAIWAASVVIGQVSDLMPVWVPDVLGSFRDGAWYAVILAVLYLQAQSQVLLRVFAIATLLVVGMHAAMLAGNLDLGRVLGVQTNSAVTGMVQVVLGLILVENMMRNLSQDQSWSAKHFGIGLYAILIFQLLVSVPEFLAVPPPEGLLAVRPLVFLLALPLFAVTATRTTGLHLRLYSSRRLVFHAATLIAAGVVLQGTAIASFYLQQSGGDYGTAFAILFGFVGAVGLAVGLASAGTRSRFKSFINENFFAYKYDYRLEWDKFIRALSAWEEGDMPLRVLRTLADLLDSHGGVLWLLRDRWSQFMPVARWSYPTDPTPLAVDDADLQLFEDESCAYLDLTAPNDAAAAYKWSERFPHSWLVVPLRYRARLIGVALLNPPRAPRSLDWEDKNFISLVALQLAASLMQEETAQALADARQLEEFNKRFAFILHDTKNTIGQLSLLVRNVEEFGDNEDFRKDMTVTLRNAVEKLQGLLGQLRGNPVGQKETSKTVEEVDLNALVATFVHNKRSIGVDIVMNGSETPTVVGIANKDAFLGVLDLMVGNAVEAAPRGSPTTVGVSMAGQSVCVTISDKGPGMTQEFIAGQLFRPLRTTKRNGFGIGAFQAREIMRDLGGNMDVLSKLGEGTTVSLTLPKAAGASEMARA